MSFLKNLFGDNEYLKKLEAKKDEELRLLKQRLATDQLREKSVIDGRSAQTIAGIQSSHQEQMCGIKDQSDAVRLDQFNRNMSARESFVNSAYDSTVKIIQTLAQEGNSAIALRIIESRFDSVVARSIKDLSKPMWDSVPDTVRQEAIQKLQALVEQKSIALRAMVTGEQ